MADVRSRHSDWHRRLRRGWRRWSWVAIGALAVATVVLGYLGFRAYFVDSGQEGSRGDALYRSLQLFGLEGGAVEPVPWQLQIARLLAPLVTALALIRAIMAIFRERLQAWRLWRMSDHVIVCGLGARGLLFAKAFRELGDEVVVIEQDEDARGVGECRDEGIVVLIGDATDEAVLDRTRPDKARHLIAVGSDDGINAEVAAETGRLVARRRGRPLEAFVHVVDPKLCALLRERESATRRAESFRLRFFNVYESGTRAWLDQYPPFGPAGEPDRCAHLVLVGVGQMGRTLVTGAVRSWLAVHYAAGRSSDGAQAGGRPRITLVDREARRERESLRSEFPALDRFCTLIAREMEIESSQFSNAEFLFDREGRRDVSSIYVCLGEDDTGLGAALTQHARLRERDPDGGKQVPIVVRMREYAGLATVLDQRGGELDAGPGETARFANLHAFQLLDRTCTPEHLLGTTPVETIARAAHEEYRTSVSASAPEWGLLSEALKESNRRQAEHARTKLRAVGYDFRPLDGEEPEQVTLSEAEVEEMAIMEHDRWVAERLFEGWVLGPEKDVERKVSPYLVGWEKLPGAAPEEDVQEYDRVMVRGLPMFLARAGFQVYRLDERGAGEDGA